MRFHAQPIKLEHFLLLFPSGHNCHCVQNVSGPMQTPWEKERPPPEHAHALGRSSPRGQAPRVVRGRMREQWSGGPSTPVRVQEERVAWSGLCGHSLNTGEGQQGPWGEGVSTKPRDACQVGRRGDRNNHSSRDEREYRRGHHRALQPGGSSGAGTLFGGGYGPCTEPPFPA